jgi:hypothetical protein
VRRKALQDIANALCPMLIGQSRGLDLDAVCELPDGTLEIDLLNATARHSSTGAITLAVAGELSGWLRSRLEALSFPISGVHAARIAAAYRTDRIPTNREKLVSFDWKCESILSTDEAEYRSPVLEKHVFHTRNAA